MAATNTNMRGREEDKRPFNGDMYDQDFTYGTMRQPGEPSINDSDWDKDSLISGGSAFSQQFGNAQQNIKKVRGLESIYL